MDNFQTSPPPGPYDSVYPENFGTSKFIPEQSPAQVPPPNRRRRTWLYIVLGAIAVGIIVVAVFVFVVFLQGKTALGKSFQDKIWENLLETSANKPLNLKATFTYNDSGKFEFVPSKALAALDFPAAPEESAKMDKDYSFTLDNLSLKAQAGGFVNFTDVQHLKLDGHWEGALSNSGATYSAVLDAKLKDKQAYVKYSLNDALQSFILSKDPSSTDLTKQKDQWLKLPEFDSSSFMDISKAIALQGDPAAKARDAKRVADVRQLESALELYYNDKGGYPESRDGKPDGLVSTYISNYPTAPSPADGNCLDKYNTYNYVTTGDSKQALSSRDGSVAKVYADYKLIFCLGDKAGSVEAGNEVATSAGINAYACPSGETCYKTAAEVATQANPYQDLLKKNRIIEIKSFKGIGVMDGQVVLHYEMQINKDKLRNVILEASKMGFPSDPLQEKYSEQFLDILLGKIQIKNYEIWVGVTDKRIYKTVFESNALSVTKTADLIYQKILSGEIKKALEGGIGKAQTSAEDAKRIADIRQSASALELYYNDFGGYPDAANGRPLGLVPSYLSTELNAPTPPGGSCSKTDNYYVYTPVGDSKTVKGPGGAQVKVYQKYKYTFCLGSATGGLAAGVRSMTEAGIDTSSQSELSPTLDQNATATSQEAIQNYVLEILKQLPFDATIKLESEINNYGKDKDVSPPPNPVDLKSQSF